MRENMCKPINQVETGKKLKQMIEKAGYDVKYIQKYLQLSCPQSIYKWYKGKRLPSIEHLFALSRLLNVHMEELLVQQDETLLQSEISKITDLQTRRIMAYAIGLRKVA